MREKFRWIAEEAMWGAFGLAAPIAASVVVLSILYLVWLIIS